MEENESNIERHARIGQTSEQLAERNAIWRIGFYGVLGGLAAGIVVNFVLPSIVVTAVFGGFIAGVALAIAIEQKMQREDMEKRSRHRAEMAREKERETLARIEAAKANGDFDRWNTNE